jgi:hypothetical protein
MVSIDNSGASFNSFMAELRQELGRWVRQRLEGQLEAEVEGWLHRGRYGRRGQVGARQLKGRRIYNAMTHPMGTVKSCWTATIVQNIFQG